MTRGNQRDTDRARAEARNAKGAAHSTLKNRDADADKLRQKQAAAEERKRQQQEDAGSLPQELPGVKRGPSEEAKRAEEERLERLRAIREKEQEKLIREQEEAAERRAAKRRAEAEAKAAQVQKQLEEAKTLKSKMADVTKESSKLSTSQPGGNALGKAANGAVAVGDEAHSHAANSKAAAEAASAASATGAVASSTAPVIIDELRDDSEQGEMEIDIPALAVGKVIGTRGAVINAIRANSGADIQLSKDADGNGTLLVQGTAVQLDLVHEIVQHIVLSDRSDPDIEAMMHGYGRFGGGAGGGRGDTVGGGQLETDYELLLHPTEASLLKQSRQLSTVMRKADVRIEVRNQEGGWVNLTIRGTASAVHDAKARVESIVQPDDGLGGDRWDDSAGGNSSGKVRSGGRSGGRSSSSGGGSTAAKLPPLVRLGEMDDNGSPRFRLEIELTNKDQVGAVIGEGGRTIHSIRSIAAVDLQVERPEDAREGSTQRRVVIVGGEEGCRKAHGLVLNVLRSNTGKRDYSQKIDASTAKVESGGLVRLSVPRHLVGRIIGTRGSSIRRLRETSGAVIDVAKDESGVGTVTINGSPGQVRAAREQIEELTQEDLPLEIQQTLSRMLEEVLVFSVPANRVGKVLGSKGAVIQGLRQQMGVQIDLQKDRDGAATITLRGPMEAMRAAKDAIQAIVNSTDEHVGDRIRL